MNSINLDELAFNLSIKDIKALLKRKEQDITKIERLELKRDKLLQQIADIDNELQGLRGSKVTKKTGWNKQVVAAKKKKSNTANVPTYRDMIYQYIASEGQAKASDIVQTVSQRRFGREPTHSESTAVRTVLSNDKNIVRIGRGLYSLEKEKLNSFSKNKKSQQSGSANKGKKKNGVSMRGVGKAKPTQLVFEYLKSNGGSGSISNVLNAIFGTDKGSKVTGVKMALGRDKRFTRKDDHISIKR